MELSDARYSGTAVTKEVAITYGGRELREGTDYTVAYRDNVAAGTAEISVTFTSPLKYGAAQMNTLDENGKFVPYTAKLPADTPVQPEDNWSEPDVTWSEDGKTCTAVFTNTATGEVKTVTVNAVGKVTKPAGSSNMGVTTYTATIVFNGMEYVYTLSLIHIYDHANAFRTASR